MTVTLRYRMVVLLLVLTTGASAQTVEELRALAPLQKVHYSFPDILCATDDPRLPEYVRITHAATVSGTFATRAEVDAKIAIVRAINTATPPPAIPASLGLCYSPWHQVFGPTLPPTDVGPTHTAELTLFRSKLSAIRQWLAEANVGVQPIASVRFSAFIYDCERFSIKPRHLATSAAWNAAIDNKFKLIFDATRSLFPAGRIEWYARGMDSGNVPTGWWQPGYMTLKEPGYSFSCSLYRLPEITEMREIFRRNVELADGYGIRSVTPWIALGAGFERAPDGSNRWRQDWPFDSIYAFLLGKEINTAKFAEEPCRYAPWNAADVVVLHPGAFDSRSPAWGKHFLEYCRGSNGP